ncbi:MAG: hypothetical protein U9R21_03275, partial [Candidatus Thermoplasmatota archaeon]|nr:hypothetical protein [Candidatus Thermoplasmatota archaeon]
AFVGVFALAMKEHLLNKILIMLVSLSAGALMGGAFIHLLPEAVKKAEGGISSSLYWLVSFFFSSWKRCFIGDIAIIKNARFIRFII